MSTALVRASAANLRYFTDPPTLVDACVSLEPGDVFRWKVRLAMGLSDATCNPTGAQHEGPWLRIIPKGPNAQDSGREKCELLRNPVTEAAIANADNTQNVAGATTLNERLAVVGGVRGVDLSQDNSSPYWYEIDASPGGSFIATFPCSLKFVAPCNGTWVFVSDVYRPPPELRAGWIAQGVSKRYNQTRTMNSTQNPRTIAVPMGAVGLSIMGDSYGGNAIFLNTEESGTTVTERRLMGPGASYGPIGGVIPIGNARWLRMTCVSAPPTLPVIAYVIEVV